MRRAFKIILYSCDYVHFVNSITIDHNVTPNNHGDQCSFSRLTNVKQQLANSVADNNRLKTISFANMLVALKVYLDALKFSPIGNSTAQCTSTMEVGRIFL